VRLEAGDRGLLTVFVTQGATVYPTP
jgi:hypothetical protein